MEGGSMNNMEQKGKAKVANVMSEDMQEQPPSFNEDAEICEEGNPEKESTVEDSSSYAGDNTELQNQPSPVAVVTSDGYDADGSASMRVEKDGETSGEKSSSYTCVYCKKMFPTAQGLGGHQNTHKYARELAKRQRLQERPLYPKYDGYSNNLSLGHPGLPMYYPKNFTTLPRPQFQYSNAMLGFPATQYSQSTTRSTLEHPGQPSDMLLNSRQLPDFSRPGMIMPNTVYNVNANYTSGNFNFGATVVGGQGGILESFGAPNVNINSMGGGLNSMGIGGVRGGGCTNPDFPTLGGNSCFPSVGFEGTHTSRGVVRNFYGVSQGESYVRGLDEGDGTIDLLSRVGMGSREDDEENDGKSQWRN
ncbi:putative transcription factor C2H2 family [Helianthus annuus]|uniref:Transcription factor C2H2 family n=1 Tax=Helianthus annuus TaxID=4232 RepID=A0A9K3IPV3_HELAN|nr:putative transcription factor C2H2 family [Helianthus annuus]KAJ0572161.1 putative transcription factor C2H2 family [Helianthus annuus]KAJ0736628.1 putative transcription factor C2H2 family [Helianthus annuus]KAJ0910263.1 putative transcription factor C2H2 family [Helianthus annuus]KAJ0913932.1 putative transcription factor C2H2 family [Helianthus annuus]